MIPYAKVILITAVVTGVGAFGVHYYSLKQTVQRLETELAALRVDYELRTTELRSVTQEREVLDKKLSTSQQRMAELQQSLSRERKRINNAPIPQDCAGAVEWLRLELR